MAKKSVKKLASKQKKQWLQILTPTANSTETGNSKVLIDTNVWYSAILYGGKPEQTVVFCWHNYQIVCSEYLLNELLGILKNVGAPYKWRNHLASVLHQSCEFVEPSTLPAISRDAKDDPIIAAAVTGGCDYLITNDKDLLELGAFDGILILTASSFLKLQHII